ncbi:protein RADIALIS-like 3 [Panicum miliaceum]|uniref:Protein RADIALIS-like 3 n=1 Tax=Panicum miliaceum TaxID=4540 RepID=A0A3L6SRX2_PANMI|nr:protein RADIALIS-like 3 [Panicum miliaceum]
MDGTKSVEEVRRHYQLLVRDVAQIESDGVPFHWYAAAPPPTTLQRGYNRSNSLTTLSIYLSFNEGKGLYSG